jgi:RHS repeat-associated protein
LPNAQDRRLAGIAHKGPGGVAVSAFGYGYDVGGSITRWTQSQPFHTVEPMSAWTIEQDAADQLTGVSVEGRAAGRQVFSYDLAGNRLTAQSGNATSTTAYNALNQITGISGGGRLRFSGTTSEAAHVSVQGRAARMLDATTFTADAEVVPGVNTIPVVATDGNGNRRTNNYQVTVTGGATRAFVYDGNGNLLDDGERTHQWDAKNRLIEAKRGADTWQWSYNAFDQRVSEKKNGVITKRWVWAGGNQPAEERDAAGNVTRRFYPQGEQAGTTKSYYTKDHLGSIREVLGANGAVVSSSRYDAWGVRTTQGAQDAASFGFTGHLEHKELGLVFTLYRAYDPATGRWLSRDPIGENGGINLYGYVVNNPVNYVDPLGLINWSTIGSAFEGKIGVGLGLQAKVQVSKLKVSSGARYTLGSWGNLGGQVGNYITAEADLIKISAGEHQLGLGAAYNLKTQMDSDPDSCPTFTEKSGGVAGYKYGGVGSKSNDWFKVGASAKLGVVDIGGSINFGTIWQGLWE